MGLLHTVSSTVEALATRVIGAAIEVHRAMGPGYLESVYQKSLEIEFILQDIPFRAQHGFDLLYKDHDVGGGRIDFLVGGELIVEIKTVDVVAPIHRAQMLSYLRAMDLNLGLILNFNAPVMKSGIHRIIQSVHCPPPQYPS